MLTGGEAGKQQDDPAAHADTERHAEAADERRHCADDERVLDWYEENVRGDEEEHVAHQEPEQQACRQRHTNTHSLPPYTGRIENTQRYSDKGRILI